MIKINKPSKELIEKYIKEVLPIVREKLKENRKDIKYGEIVAYIEEDIEGIIGADIHNLLKKYDEIQSRFPNKLKKMGKKHKISKEQKACNKFFERIFDYKKIIQDNIKLSYEVAKMLNVTVCPYCNRIYTTTCDSKNGKSRPQFDHFFAKSLYPILALSIYNLVPSCNICNTKKGSKEFSLEDNIYPYQEGINESKYFSYQLDEYGNPKIITSKENYKMVNNDKILLIEDIYQIAHSRLVGDLLEKRQRYSKVYIEELDQLKGIRKITKEELKYFLGYSINEEISNVSLGKLKNDIIDEII